MPTTEPTTEPTVGTTDRASAGRRIAIADGIRTHRLDNGDLLVENGVVAHQVHDPAAALVLETLALAGGEGSVEVLEDLAEEVGRHEPVPGPASDAAGLATLPDVDAGAARVARSAAGLVVEGVLDVSPPRSTHLGVVDLEDGGDTAADVTALLREGGTLVSEGAGCWEPSDTSVVLVVCPDVLRADVTDRLRSLLDGGAVVLPVAVGAGEFSVGPLLAPGPCTDASRCLTCLRDGLSRNLPGVLLEARTNPDGALHRAVPGPLLAAVGVAVTATLALDVARALSEVGTGRDAGHDPDLLAILTWGTGDIEPTTHPVLSSCPSPSIGSPTPVQATVPQRPGPRPLRALSAQEVLTSTARLVDERTGLLAAPRVIAGGPTGFVASTTCAVPSGADGGWQRVVAHGAGLTREQALASAVGEAVERCSTGWGRGAQEPTIRACARDLGSAAILPQDLLAFGDEQRSGPEPGVPQAMPRDAVADWCRLREWPHPAEGRSATERWVPAAALHFGHPDQHVARWCLPDSNGCATGADEAEAVLAGLLELVERDAVARWWYPAGRVPGLALETLDLDPAARSQTEAVRDRLRAVGGDLHLLDVTSDLGVPVVVAVGVGATHTGPRGRGDTGDGLLLGFGAHPETSGAAARAVGELAMLTTLVESGLAATPAGWDSARLADLPFLQPAHDAPRAPLITPTGGLDEVLPRVVERVRAAGTTVLVQDLTRPWSTLRTVRVVAPGLRPWYRRLAPGRLSPSEHGWNPWPLPV